VRSANVHGTRNVIEFALFGRVKKLAYISTDGIFPDGLKGIRETTDIQEYSGALEQQGNGYSQSKWVAEMLVRSAADRGLPTIVFRPGNMGGVGDVWNPCDFNFLVLQGCIEIGAAPQVDGWITEMTPVDFAAKAIVQLARDSDNVGATFRVTTFANCRPATECIL
jgi:thioester reductase-like protein